MYKEVDVNQPIPDKLYAAVAEVLAYVYQLKNKSMPVRRSVEMLESGQSPTWLRTVDRRCERSAEADPR